MQRIRLGLKARFVAASLLLVSISTIGYYFAVAQFVEFLEAELRDTTLLGELDVFARHYARDPGVPGPRAAGLSSYVLVPGADPDELPAALRGLAPGVHEEIHLDGHEVVVARRDVQGARLFVALDMEPVEQLEARFVGLAWACALLSWFAAVAAALWLAQRVLRPVSELAARVGQMHPGNDRVPLAPEFGDQDIGIIAAAFDRFMDRMEAFVGREQAFTEDASHELRTPLTVIDSAAQLLADDPQLAAPARERVQRIRRAAAQMQGLMEALLFLAREEGGQAEESLDLQQVVTELIDTQREAIAAKQLQLVLQMQAALVQAPRGMTHCVVGNLLANAIHYTQNGRIELTVEPGLLRVRDTGTGIAPEDLGHIFERRYRGAQSRGLGLGLYLVKRICDRLGWALRVAHADGGGSVFEVRFPPR